MPFRLKGGAAALVAAFNSWEYGISLLPAAVFTALFGNRPYDLVALAFGFIGMDVATGVIKGIRRRELSSKRMRAGLTKKCMMVASLSFGHMCDHVLGGTGNLGRNFFSVYVISAEGLSILENMASCGVVLPEKARAVLRALFENAGEESLTALGREAGHEDQPREGGPKGNGTAGDAEKRSASGEGKVGHPRGE